MLCDLEAAKLRRPRADFGCYATEKKHVRKLQIPHAFTRNIELNTIIVHAHREFYSLAFFYNIWDYNNTTI
jgi:hypothetical protein